MSDSYLGLSHWVVCIFSISFDKILVLGPIFRNLGFQIKNREMSMSDFCIQNLRNSVRANLPANIKEF